MWLPHEETATSKSDVTTLCEKHMREKGQIAGRLNTQ